jgi:hypothetical protein
MVVCMDRDRILKEGKINIRIRHSGMYQNLEFVVIREKTGFGEIPFLKIDRPVDASELMRIADEVQLPIISLSGKVFPKGRAMMDFVGL